MNAVMEQNITVRECLQNGIRFLKARRVPEARISAEYLLAYLLKQPRVFLYVESSAQLGPELQDEYQRLLDRRARRVPVQYLVGTVPFRNTTLHVGPGCLIPRPETEILADVVLRTLGPEPIRVLDVGTGSGNIAVSLAVERPAWHVVATDVSRSALRYAEQNAIENGVENRVRFVHTDLWAHVQTDAFDGFISNPPYLNERELAALEPEVSFEPEEALWGSSDGLYFYRKMISGVREVLRPGGTVFLEVGFDQADPVSDLLRTGGFQRISAVRDYAGVKRVVSAQLKEVSRG